MPTVDITVTESAERSMEQEQRDFYESHRHRIFSLAFYMTGNEIEAEQVLGDSFIQAFAAAPKPDGKTVDSALIGELRKRVSLAPSDLPMHPSSSTEMTGKNIRRTDLEEAIKELPAVERLLFLMRDVEGYSPEAIAELTDIPKAQVSRMLLGARIRLRGILAELEARRAA